MQTIKNIDLSRGFGLDVSIAALIPVHLLTSKVALGSETQRLAPEAVCLAVGESEDVFVSSDAVKRVLGHIYNLQFYFDYKLKLKECS